MNKDVDRIRCRRARAVLGAIACAAVAIGLSAAPSGAAANGPAGDCQPFASKPCLLPFPNDLFTKPTKGSKTGLRVDLPQAAMPTNQDGAQIDVGPYDRNDGFSPGSAIVVRVPGLDNAKALSATDPVPLTNMSKTFKKNAPIVLIDAKTGKRQLIWVEIDSNAASARDTTLLIHPGTNLDYGHRYIVAMRNLKNAGGEVLEAPSWFAKLRDGKKLPADERSQKSRYQSIFRALKKAGINRGNLYEAWDFTVGSRKSLTKSVLHIRNAAFRGLGDTNLADGKVDGHAPAFHVDNVDQNPAAGIAEYVTGTFRVPCYLKADGCPTGSDFNYSSGKRYAAPQHEPGNVAKPNFYCIVPKAATPANPGRGSLYGHGLLLSGTQITFDYIEAFAREHNFVICATDWWGMSSADVPYDISALSDLNKFPPVVDRLQQGFLNTLFLSRLLRTPDGLVSDPAFQKNGKPLIDTSSTYYYGNSQGGILGGALTAVAPDFTHSVLGATGMDFGGLLLQRSTDFTAYATFLYGQAGTGGYPDTSIHPLLLSLVEQLWQRGEAVGYAARMTSDPLRNTPAHEVLMETAYGDFEVSQYAASVEARTIGAKAHEPALNIPPRNQDRNLFYKIPAIPSYPYDGSGIVIWDTGPRLVQPPPITNTAPIASDVPPLNLNPHTDPRNTPAARTQMSAFLRPNGKIVDTCHGDPCHAIHYTP